MSERDAKAWDAGFMAAINAAPDHVWFPAWDDVKNPYREAKRD